MEHPGPKAAISPCCAATRQADCCPPEAKGTCCAPDKLARGACDCAEKESPMETDNNEAVRANVRERYAKVAQAGAGCCGGAPCGDGSSLELGYTKEDLASVPAGADMGLGCGNPQAIAALRAGETVLDLGSGGGFDCFLAAKQVGASGRVIGVDMTAEMIAKARKNARSLEASNVEFRLGEIEHLPVADASVDIVISNCVVNLSPDKPQVYREAFRALRPGGRIAISDVVSTKPLPDDVRTSLEAFAGCVAGAAAVSDVQAMLAAAGFRNVRVDARPESRAFIRDWLPDSGIEDFIMSATIEATKP